MMLIVFGLEFVFLVEILMLFIFLFVFLVGMFVFVSELDLFGLSFDEEEENCCWWRCLFVFLNRSRGGRDKRNLLVLGLFFCDFFIFLVFLVDNMG